MILAFFIIFTVLCIGGGTTLPAFLEILAVAAALSALLFLAAWKAFGYDFRQEVAIYRMTPLLAAFGATLTFEILKANLRVMARILKRGQPQGRVIRFRSGLQSRFANMLLANAITLTPGTITVHTNGDEFSVHCLEESYGAGVTDSVPARLTRRIDRIAAAARPGPKKEKQENKEK